MAKGKEKKFWWARYAMDWTSEKGFRTSLVAKSQSTAYGAGY